MLCSDFAFPNNTESGMSATTKMRGDKLFLCKISLDFYLSKFLPIQWFYLLAPVLHAVKSAFRKVMNHWFIKKERQKLNRLTKEMLKENKDDLQASGIDRT